jgi:hypothetical protein
MENVKMTKEECVQQFQVGQKVFVRTVTNYLTGEIVSVNGDFVNLKDAAWIADTGRYADALKSGDFSEVEPYPENMQPFFNMQSVVDGGFIEFDLPKVQK